MMEKKEQGKLSRHRGWLVFLICVAAVVALFAILGGAARYGDRSNAFTAWMGKRSFGLYVFHYLGISTCGLLIGQQRTLPAAAVYLLTLAAGFLGGYLLNEVISRVPLLRWTVLGIGKER